MFNKFNDIQSYNIYYFKLRKVINNIVIHTNVYHIYYTMYIIQ